MIDLPKSFERQWQHFLQSTSQNKLSHALLFVGTDSVQIQNFADFITAYLFCSSNDKPCGMCADCLMLINDEHPDYYVLTPEEKSKIIKIDQIRQLQTRFGQTPSRGKQQIIKIIPLESLQNAGANALLKTLEEPSQNTMFILQASHLANVPATIISRCQLWQFPDHRFDGFDLCLLAGGDDKRQNIAENSDLHFSKIYSYYMKQIPLQEMIKTWGSIDLSHVLWFLYLVNHQLLKVQSTDEINEQTHSKEFILLSKVMTSYQLLAQLDTIKSLQKLVIKNIAINRDLAIESIFLSEVAV